MRRALGLGWRVGVFAALAVVAFLLPQVVSDFRLIQFASVGIYFIAIFGLNIVTGYSGQISLGHGAFMAIGGYTTAMLIVHRHWNDLATLPVAGLVAGVAGLLFGVPALRFSGLYLAIVTFALAVATPSVIKKWGLTGGSSGLSILSFHSNRWYYAVTWISAGILFVLGWIVLQLKPSRAWRALRDSEVAAAASGVNVAAYKIAAFGMSAAYAGVAGGVLALLSFGATPGNFPVQLSIYLVVGLVVGRLGPLIGPLVGALFVEYVQVYAPEWVSKSPGVPTVAFGLALIFAVFVATALGALTSRLAFRSKETT
jgi:branched-chain amino acid transport system permease protein